MRRISLLAGGIALALAGGLSLTGCDQVTQSAKDAAPLLPRVPPRLP